MWQKLWGYKEGFAICSGLFVTGLMLQAIIGKTNLDLLSFPVNIMAGSVYILLIAGTWFLFRKHRIIRWVGSYQATVSSMVSIVVMTVIMGLTRQLSDEVIVTGIVKYSGFSQMLSSWPFTLLLIWFITILGMVTLRRISVFNRKKDIPFVLNHAGLFIALVAAILGNPDMQRLEMTAVIGKPEWRAFSKKGELVELPLAIELHDFTIDEYPPKLMLVDNETGKVLPEGNPYSILLDDNFTTGNLDDWQISLLQRLPMSATIATTDTLKYVEYYSTGAAYSVHIEAVNTKTNEKHEGWISCGSFIFPYKAIRLNDRVSIIMPEREPKRYTSDVSVYTQAGKNERTTIEVNKPFSMEGWIIYQLSYDENKGPWSDTSVFELVRDPWLPVVYAGILMMIAGAFCMISIPGMIKN